MTNQQPSTPPGWYPDERNPGVKRYWTGTGWRPDPAPKQRKPWTRQKTIVVVVVVAVLFIAGLISQAIQGSDDAAPSPTVRDAPETSLLVSKACTTAWSAWDKAYNAGAEVTAADENDAATAVLNECTSLDEWWAAAQPYLGELSLVQNITEFDRDIVLKDWCGAEDHSTTICSLPR